MDAPDLQPSTPSRGKTPSLPMLVAGIVIVSVVVGTIAGLIARQSMRDSAQFASTVAALQKDLDALRSQVKTLMGHSERTVVLSLVERGYAPVRTNGGTLLVAVGNVEGAEKGLRVYLQVGNPQSMAYEGFTLGLVWDKGTTTRAFPDVLAPGTWTVVSVVLAPADPTTTKSLTITSASVDQISVR